MQKLIKLTKNKKTCTTFQSWSLERSFWGEARRNHSGARPRRIVLGGSFCGGAWRYHSGRAHSGVWSKGGILGAWRRHSGSNLGGMIGGESSWAGTWRDYSKGSFETQMGYHSGGFFWGGTCRVHSGQTILRRTWGKSF